MDSNDVQFVVVDNPHATRDALDAAGSAANGLAAEPWTPGAFQAVATAAAKARAGERAARVLPIARELKGQGKEPAADRGGVTDRHVGHRAERRRNTLAN
jgi:hypothetical protein